MNDEELYHYGMKRRSGRYPWGSGKDPQRSKSFLKTADELKKKGLSEKEIASAMKITDEYGNPSINALRAIHSRSVIESRKADMADVVKYRDKGYSWEAVAKKVGLPNESSARSLYKRAKSGNKEQLDLATDILKSEIAKKRFIDVSDGSEINLGVTNQKMKTAVQGLVLYDGYNYYTPSVPNVGMRGKRTKFAILCDKDATFNDAVKALKENKLGIIGEHIEKDGTTGNYKKYGLETPKSISSDKVFIRYNEDGGVDRDGVIELRRNVPELNLGSSHYAQVRIAVDGTHYLKGMAMYGDDIPKGYDIVFNTNKHRGTPKLSDDPDNTVLKMMKKDPENPFGSSVVQHHYKDSKGKDQLSALNIVGSTENDEHKEGSWNTWSKQISAQFLSKQNPKIAKRQLDRTYSEKLKEYEEITKLTNPTVKKQLLEEFSNKCDSDAVDLKASGFPRQRSQVILPFPDMKENEIYAPNFKNGEEVALVRFPHAGTFEIPTLKVNNKVSVGSAQKLITNAKDAVGINPKVASILSGADFDGDTVVVIPTSGNNLKTRKTTKLTNDLKNLQNFEPKEIYKLPEDAPRMSEKTKQREMGVVSNLITDMTIRNASSDEMARAVRYSMVVIDAEKHHLDYKKAALDNNISELKKLYQPKGDGTYGGVSTLISRSKSEQRVPGRKDYYLSKNTIDSEGNKIYTESGKTYKQIKDPVTGKWRILTKKDVVTSDTKIREVPNMDSSTKMAEAKDAMELLSGPKHEGSTIERVYGDYANKMKDLARKARLEYVKTKDLPYNPTAAKVYAPQVQSINNKLFEYDKQKPYERRAQIIANKVITSEKQSYKSTYGEDMGKEELRKIKGRALRAARESVYSGGKRYRPDITPSEWEAIQAGAITKTKMVKLFHAADDDQVKKYATPRKDASSSLPEYRKNQIINMKNSGVSAADIADSLGVSVSTVYDVTRG